MTTALRLSAIVPLGFLVDRVSIDDVTTSIDARWVGATGQCPDCRLVSARVHSRYQRRLADLPLAGRVIRIFLMARRFRCMSALCRRSIFTERFSDDVLAVHSRSFQKP